MDRKHFTELKCEVILDPIEFQLESVAFHSQTTEKW